MIVIYDVNGNRYEYPTATRYKFGGDTIKIYNKSTQIGNFVIENMTAAAHDGEPIKLAKRSNA